MGSGDDSSESEEPTVVHRGPDGALLSESEKVAVLFGNDNYDEPANKLTCCEADVAALMPKFHGAGFLPMLSCDVSGDRFWKCIEHARQYIGGKTKVVVFHWSGHGLYDDKTWLLATDGKRIDLHEALEKLLDKITKSVMTFVILDCCRTSPAIATSGSIGFESSIEREKQNGDIWKERCEEMYVKAPLGHAPKRRKFIFFFATGLGEPAREGRTGRHGALTSAVLEHLFKEGELLTIINDINSQVQRNTKQHQLSWISSNIEDVICNPIMLNSCCFKVAREASRKIRGWQVCLDKQRKLTEDCARQIIEMNERRRVEGSNRDAHDEPPPPGLQSSPPQSPSLQASRRRSSSSTRCSFPQKADKRKLWIAIDGNIGVGKTTLLMDNFIREISPNAETLTEPVEKWSLGPLKKMYSLTVSASDIFEAQCQIFHHFQGMADQYQRLPDKVTAYLTERSPISAVKIFCQNFLDDGRITRDHFEIFRSYFQLLQQRECLPTHYVLLQASVATCQKRIKGRQRQAEQSLPDAYLKSIEALLDKVYKQVEKDGGAKVIRIKADGSEEAVKNAFLQSMGAVW